jgi:hypothetical protein
MIHKWANSIAWPPDIDVKIDISKPIKIEELNVNGLNLWAHPAWTKVVDKSVSRGKPWGFGAMPGTRQGAVAWSKIATAGQEKPAGGLVYPDAWPYEPPQGTVEFHVVAMVGDVGSGSLYVTSNFGAAVVQASDCPALLKKKGTTLTGESVCSIVARVDSEAWPDELQKKYPPPGKYVVEKFNADGEHIEWKNPDWEKLQAEEPAEEILPSDQAAMTVGQALRLSGLSYLTDMALNAHPGDALLTDVWGDLSMEVQSDVQIAIGKASAKILGKKRADIYNIYPTVRDDVRYVIQSGVKGGPEGVMQVSGGKSPESAMFAAFTETEKQKKPVAIIKKVEVTKGVFRNLHTFRSDGSLAEKDKELLDPSMSKSKHTGLKHGVPHRFVFVDADGSVTGLEGVNFSTALANANVIETQLPGDMFGTMLLDVSKSVFFKITGMTTADASVWVVTYGLPEGYIKSVNTQWAAATGIEAPPEIPAEKERAKKDIWADLDDALVGNILDMLSLSDEAREDLFQNAQSGDTMAAVWDLISDHTKTEVKNAWREELKKVEPLPEEKSWNAWTVQEVIQLPLSPNTKKGLKTLGGGLVLGEVMHTFPKSSQDEIMNAIDDWVTAMKEPKKWKVEKPAEGTPTTELTFGQVKMFLGVSIDAQDALDTAQALQGKKDSDTLGSVWVIVAPQDKQDITLAYDDWKIEQLKVPQEKPEVEEPKELKAYFIPSEELGAMAPAEVASKLSVSVETSTKLTYGNASTFDDLHGAWKVLSDDAKRDILKKWKETEGGQIAKAKLKKKKKKKAPKKPTAAQAMKALQLWKIADAIMYLDIPQHVKSELESVSHEPKKQTVMNRWSMLSSGAQHIIVNAWMAHKKTKQAEPKKSKKGKKAPTLAQAEKNLKTWKVASVFGFLDPSVHDYVHAAAAMTGKTGPQVKLSELWDKIVAPGRKKLVQAYAEFMKKKHKLESAAAIARGYLVEAGVAEFPRIVLRKDYGAAGGRDLYFIKWRADGRRYCYALGVAIRSDIERIESFSAAKAASIVKARSLGEYDCETGEIKHVEPKPKKARKKRRRAKSKSPPEPAQVQTTLFGESVEASMYVLEQGARRRVLVEAVYRADLLRILEDVDDPDAAEIAVASLPRRGMHPQDKKVRTELQSSKYPATAEKDKAFVFRWADGRGICAFKHKKDAVAWINDDVNSPNGPEIVKWWYGDPYTKQYDNRQKGKKKQQRLRVATSYTPVKPKKGKKTEAMWESKPPVTYTSIGHQTKNQQPWYLKRGSDDIAYGELGSTHAQFTKDFSHADVFGRIDHDSKLISVWDSGTGRSDYAISILRMDFPGYEVWLSGAGSDSVRVSEAVEDVDRDAEADRMLDRYLEEPTSIWLYTDMPVKDRVAWAYLAADRFKGVEGEDLVERFIETLHQVVDDPETFWQQIREKSPVRANYLDHLDWDIDVVQLKDVGVYPRFGGFSSEVSQGSVLDTAEAVEATSELPEKVAKLREMSDVWMTILKFLPPILVPGGILRSEERGYDVLKWTCDDGNHRLVSAAMAGAKEAVCFVGTQKKEKIEPARLVMPGEAESVVMGMAT